MFVKIYFINNLINSQNFLQNEYEIIYFDYKINNHIYHVLYNSIKNLYNCINNQLDLTTLNKLYEEISTEEENAKKTQINTKIICNFGSMMQKILFYFHFHLHLIIHQKNM